MWKGQKEEPLVSPELQYFQQFKVGDYCSLLGREVRVTAVREYNPPRLPIIIRNLEVSWFNDIGDLRTTEISVLQVFQLLVKA